MPSRRTVLAATAGVSAVLAIGTDAHAEPAAAPDDPASGDADHTASDGKLRPLIARMTLEEKVGQLFVMRVYGHSATEPDQADIDANLQEIGVRTAAESLAEYRVGGIVYFSWAHNIRDPHQIAGLSHGIQKASLDLPRGLPVLISTDQEHGIVARIGEPATLPPGAMALGAGGSRADAREAGRIGGAEPRALGIRQDYAPVADVNVDPAAGKGEPTGMAAAQRSYRPRRTRATSRPWCATAKVRKARGPSGVARCRRVTLDGGATGVGMRGMCRVQLVRAGVLVCAVVLAGTGLSGCQARSGGMDEESSATATTTAPTRPTGYGTVFLGVGECGSFGTTSFTEAPCAGERAAARVLSRHDGRVSQGPPCPATTDFVLHISETLPTIGADEDGDGSVARGYACMRKLRPPHPGDPGGGGGPRTIVGDCVYGAGRGEVRETACDGKGKHAPQYQVTAAVEERSRCPASTDLYVQVGGSKPVGCAVPV